MKMHGSKPQESVSPRLIVWCLPANCPFVGTRLLIDGFSASKRNQIPYHGHRAELVFEAVQEADGGYCAECLTENIFTEGDTWEELRSNVIDATEAFFFDQPKPKRIRLHLERDEVLSIA